MTYNLLRQLVIPFSEEESKCGFLCHLPTVASNQRKKSRFEPRLGLL